MTTRYLYSSNLFWLVYEDELKFFGNYLSSFDKKYLVYSNITHRYRIDVITPNKNMNIRFKYRNKNKTRLLFFKDNTKKELLPVTVHKESFNSIVSVICAKNGFRFIYQDHDRYRTNDFTNDQEDYRLWESLV